MTSAELLEASTRESSRSSPPSLLLQRDVDAAATSTTSDDDNEAAATPSFAVLPAHAADYDRLYVKIRRNVSIAVKTADAQANNILFAAPLVHVEAFAA